jgi:hypothetical protein
VPGLRKWGSCGKCCCSREDCSHRAPRPARRSTSSCGGVALLGYDGGEVAENAAIPPRTVRIAHRDRARRSTSSCGGVALLLRWYVSARRLHAGWWISASSRGERKQTKLPVHFGAPGTALMPRKPAQLQGRCRFMSFRVASNLSLGGHGSRATVSEPAAGEGSRHRVWRGLLFAPG